ncbi:hypothetical protein CHARACLAT_026300 [Characodon lateralis]|uniref:Uncharacterized protein n=1 Tax=Characodon lateralis TaxID=208331 RepID=A0ABU7F030_9TELE|nr:hypothetical protein [Characodon lateralis]
MGKDFFTKLLSFEERCHSSCESASAESEVHLRSTCGQRDPETSSRQKYFSSNSFVGRRCLVGTFSFS